MAICRPYGLSATVRATHRATSRYPKVRRELRTSYAASGCRWPAHDTRGSQETAISHLSVSGVFQWHFVKAPLVTTFLFFNA